MKVVILVILVTSAAFAQCPPTAQPFVDNFESPTLDSCWTWIREDTSHWSLTERPGWMRIVTQSCDANSPCENILLRHVADAAFVAETKIEIDPGLSSWAMLVVYLDDQNAVNIARQPQGDVRTCSWTNGVPAYVDLNVTWNPIYFRISKQEDLYSTYASSDGIAWTYLTTWQRDLAVSDQINVGLSAGNYPGGEERVADFDYFRVDSLGPLLYFSPTEINFGLKDIGADSVATIVLNNPGSVATIIDSIAHSLPEFVVDTSGLNGQVNPQSTYNLNITFAPSVPGSYYDELVIVAQRAGDDTLVIPMYGEAAIIPVAPESLVVRRGTGNNVNLHWNPVSETISGQPLMNPLYHVHAATTEAGPFLEIGNSDSTGFVHVGILSGPVRYFYTVTASAQ